MAVALPFIPYVSAAMTVVQAKQQSAIGKFNQSVQNFHQTIFFFKKK
jgi:hypothetical protein